MKATILVGTDATSGVACTTEFTRELTGGGWSVASYALPALIIPPCGGEFDCWLRFPGKCGLKGPHQEILTSIVQSDLLVTVTPVTWGGYNYELKKFMDHIIPFISPLMEKHREETHHVRRYPHPPDMLAIGILEEPDPVLEGLFESVVRRNVLNLRHERYDIRFIYSGRNSGELETSVTSWLPLRFETRTMAMPDLSVHLQPPAELPARPPGKALFLVGSPNGWKGHSGLVGKHMAEKMKDQGIAVVFASSYAAFNSENRMGELTREVASSDLVLLTTPLYVDQLPAPVIRVLEKLSETIDALNGTTPPRLAILVNSGFPEPTHNETAIAICRQFALLKGWEWAGGISIPGGGMLEGKSLDALGGRVRSLRFALELAGQRLAEGFVIPAEAIERARKLSVPFWLYRLIANMGFRWMARGRRIMAQPDRAE